MMCSVVDFHSHILPGIDDGSRSVEESLEMLRLEAQQGISCVVATPHIYANRDNLDRFLKRRSHSEQILRSALSEDHPQVVIGAEVYYFTGISESAALPKLGIGDTKHILIEMPHPPWTEAMYRELSQIYNKQGMIPIIAHIDRYISRFRTFGIPKRLENLPVLVQANAEFFLNKRTASMALRMLRSGKIHLLGSDCHNLKDRKPNLTEAITLIEQRLGTDSIQYIAESGQNVLSGDKI